MKQGPYSPGNKKDKIGYETQRKKTLIPPYKNKDYAISIQIKKFHIIPVQFQM